MVDIDAKVRECLEEIGLGSRWGCTLAEAGLDSMDALDMEFHLENAIGRGRVRVELGETIAELVQRLEQGK